MLFDNPLTTLEVDVSVESSTIVVENVELVETCILYVEAPVDAFHVNVNDVDWFVAPVAGVASTGADGAAEVVPKLQTVE